MDKTKELLSLMKERILVLDGAMGTMIQQKNLSAEDFGGRLFEGCNEHLVLTRPDIIRDIHCSYFSAGADIVETNTFGGTPLVLAEYGLADKFRAINKKAAEIAKSAANEFSTSGKPRFVAGSMGPTTKAISVTGGIGFEDLAENFHKQALGLLEGGVDLLILETSQDTRNIKAGVIGIHRAFDETGLSVPLVISGTIEPSGTMLAGQSADAFVVSLQHLELLAIGLNCATGPEFMTSHLRVIHELTTCGVSCYPNAGLPDENGKYPETPETLAKKLERFAGNGWLNIVGGCCGTTEAHIREIARMVEGKKPRRQKDDSTGRSFYCGIDVVESTPENRPLLVGERTNIIGSRLFKNLVCAEKWEEATDIARRQVKNGAHIIDVCLQGADRDEFYDVDPFYEKLTRKIKAPIMIDSTNPRVIEKSLTYCQGKSIINSINLEDGEKKFSEVCPLAKKYGSALVVGCIDEDPKQAQAFTRERKLEVARRSCRLLTAHYGIPRENIIFDPLVFPCATGDSGYIGGAVETIEGIRLIKKEFPYCRTIAGISNVSFGLPGSAREVVNSVFLYYATKAGLDLAIVNTEGLERFALISEEEKRLAENLLFNLPGDWRSQSTEQRLALNRACITAITKFYRGKTKKEKKQKDLPLDERLSRYIIEGSKDGLVDDLNLKLKEGARPLDIVNGPLMAGMTEVGRLFNKNELIVAEVLQSAEAMKAAVGHLEQFMEKTDTAKKGKVLLATVKGDVHDIGKNLVEIILKNNGYEVINLGIKVPPEEIIRACREHNPDIIGLSGLLVKSTEQMAATAGDLKTAGIRVPILVGGAALSDKFTRTRIAPSYTHNVFYAKDAMAGLDLANKLINPKSCEELAEQLRRGDLHDRPQPGQTQGLPLPAETNVPDFKIHTNIPIPPVPYLDRKICNVPQLEEIWSCINPLMLYVRHLGFRGAFEKRLAEGNAKAVELKKHVDEVKKEASRFMKIMAVWQFFEAEPDGDNIHLFEPGADLPVHTFKFNRQRKKNGLCLSDYVLSPQKNPDGKKARDHIAIFVVSAGYGIRERSEELKEKGEYLKSHILSSLAIESAEACAEWLHKRLRREWGFPDPAHLTTKDLFTAKYRGKRYSFGYPACPNLEDQAGIWKLIDPTETGVTLTEGMMMDPEASVSALVFHHPDCVYFGVGKE